MPTPRTTLVASLAVLALAGCSDPGRAQSPPASPAPAASAAPAASTSVAKAAPATAATSPAAAAPAAPPPAAPAVAKAEAKPAKAKEPKAKPDTAKAEAKPDAPGTAKAKPADAPAKPKPEPKASKEAGPAPSPFAADVGRMIRYGKVDSQRQAALEAKVKESEAAYAAFRQGHAATISAASDELAAARKAGDQAAVAAAQGKVDAAKAEDKAFILAERSKQLATLTPEQRHGYAGHHLWLRIWKQFDGVDMTAEQGAQADVVCAGIAAKKAPGDDAWIKDPGIEALRAAESEAIAAVEAQVFTADQRAKLPAVRAERAAKSKPKDAAGNAK